MFPTRCTRCPTEMRHRSKLRRRSYSSFNRLTDYQLQFRGYVLLCRRGTHSQVISVFCHSLYWMALLSNDIDYRPFFINFQHNNHTFLIHFFNYSAWNWVYATLTSSIEESEVGGASEVAFQARVMDKISFTYWLIDLSNITYIRIIYK